LNSHQTIEGHGVDDLAGDVVDPLTGDMPTPGLAVRADSHPENADGMRIVRGDFERACGSARGLY